MKRRVWGPYQNIVKDDLNDIGTFAQEAVEMALAVIKPPARLAGLQASAVGSNTVKVTAGWMVVSDSTVGRPRLGVLAEDTNLTVSGPDGTYLVVATVSERDLETRTIAPPPQTLPNGQPNPFYDPALNSYNQVTLKGWRVSLSLRPGSYTPADREAVVAQVTWNGSAITGVTQVLGWPMLDMADRSIPAIKIADDLAGNGTSRNASGGIQVNVDNFTVEISSNTLRVKDGGITDAKLGNRTIADGASPSSDAGTPTSLLSGLANRIKAITGGTSWRDAPATTISELNANVARKGNNETITGAWTFALSESGTLRLSKPFGDLLYLHAFQGGLGNTGSIVVKTDGGPDGTAYPALKLSFIDDGLWSAHLAILTKVPGASTNPLTERLRLTSQGRLGIGVSNPSEALEVNGNVKASFFIGSLMGNADTASKLQTARTISISGDATGSTTFDGSANVNISLSLANTGVTAGTYTKVTVDAKGRVTSGATLSATDFPPHTHDAADITSGRLSPSRLPTSSTANTVLAVTTANGDPVYSQVTTGMIADGSVTTSKIADGAITTVKLSDTGVTAGTYTKVTVDAKGRVTSGATLSATDFPPHTHDAADITSGRLSLARLPTSLVANRVLLVESANTDPVYGQITPNHLGTGWVPYSRIVGNARMGLVILNPEVVTAWNVTASHSPFDDANMMWQVDPGAFGVDSALSPSSSTFRVPIPGFWNTVYDVYSVQVATVLYNVTSPLNPPSPLGTSGTVIVGGNTDIAYQVLGFEVVNNILWVWLKRARLGAADGYYTRAFIQVLGRNNGNPPDSRLVVTPRNPLPNNSGYYSGYDKPSLAATTTGGTVGLLYFIGFLHHIPSLHGTASRTVNISLVNAPSGVTLGTTSVTLSNFNLLLYNNLNLNIPFGLPQGGYDFAVRFTYGAQTADIPVRLVIIP